jgi:hypothetical protein
VVAGLGGARPDGRVESEQEGVIPDTDVLSISIIHVMYALVAEPCMGCRRV